jgi:hypothetical protein
MLWHQAVSSVSDLEALDDYEASLLRFGGLVTEVTPQHTRVRFRLQAIQDFLHKTNIQEE